MTVSDRITRLRDHLAGPTPHGSLTRWLRRHHAEFAIILAEQGADWPKLAAFFAAEGLTDSAGRPPSAEAARATWRRVVKRVQARPQALDLTKPAPPPLQEPPQRPFPEGGLRAALNGDGAPNAEEPAPKLHRLTVLGARKDPSP